MAVTWLRALRWENEKYCSGKILSSADEDVPPMTMQIGGKQKEIALQVCAVLLRVFGSWRSSAVGGKAQVKKRREPNFYNSPFPLEASE